MEENILVFLVSFGAALLSSMSGGGSSAIVLPLFLSMGLSFPLATAIQKVSAVFWAPTAAWNYLRGRKIDWPFVVLFTVIGLVGAYIGVKVVLGIDERILEVVVGILILLLVIHTVLQKHAGLEEKFVTSRTRRLLAYPFALLMGFYESVFGSGNGILFAVVAMKTRGFDFIDALGHYFLIATFWVLFATLLLLMQGFYDIPLMLAGALGSIAGAYLGSAFARFKGNVFIRMVFAIVGTLLGLKLLLGL